MPRKPLTRRAIRLSRPDSERFLTVMVVFLNRTFRWSLTISRMAWIAGIAGGLGAIATVGSAYGFWATKKIMDFNKLQQETQEQVHQLRSALDQAEGLEKEIQQLRSQHTELLKLLDPRAPGPTLPTLPRRGEGPPPPPPGNPAEKLSRLRGELERRAEQANLIRARMEPILTRWMHTPSIPPTAGYLSSGFGIRISPFSRRGEEDEGLLGYHTGLDITNAQGTPIQATADGVVAESGWMGRYGWGVVLQHTDDLETLYAHLERIEVLQGQKVSRGQILGKMGRSGNATGVHLHYEVRRAGKPINPMPYMKLQKEWLRGLG
ncbi:MAG: peptidoglycan DD-metalloendopeptidase family protein [Acidobacteria bacterium]|nr:peptidoglycan DD-metalloendopeptidase family protein [Acidobacteriota bacterium]